MTYYCGIGPRMAAIGVPSEAPRFVCDGCSVTHVITGKVAPLWFLKGEAPPRREKVLSQDEPSLHYCPTCKITRRIEEVP